MRRQERRRDAVQQASFFLRRAPEMLVVVGGCRDESAASQKEKRRRAVWLRQRWADKRHLLSVLCGQKEGSEARGETAGSKQTARRAPPLTASGGFLWSFTARRHLRRRRKTCVCCLQIKKQKRKNKKKKTTIVEMCGTIYILWCDILVRINGYYNFMYIWSFGAGSCWVSSDSKWADSVGMPPPPQSRNITRNDVCSPYVICARCKLLKRKRKKIMYIYIYIANAQPSIQYGKRREKCFVLYWIGKNPFHSWYGRLYKVGWFDMVTYGKDFSLSLPPLFFENLWWTHQHRPLTFFLFNQTCFFSSKRVIFQWKLTVAPFALICSELVIFSAETV